MNMTIENFDTILRFVSSAEVLSSLKLTRDQRTAIASAVADIAGGACDPEAVKHQLARHLLLRDRMLAFSPRPV